jgi:ribosome-binding ATPase YchF (GTP1/OBG family)
MKIETLRKDLAVCEKRLNKIQKGLAEKSELERKIAVLKEEIDKIEKEQSLFFSQMNTAGITLDEAKAKLGLSTSKPSAGV